MPLVKNYGLFSEYVPTIMPPGYAGMNPKSIIFCKNEAGDDFYGVVYRIGQPATQNIFMLVDPDGLVRSVAPDIDTSPPGRTMLPSPQGRRVLEFSDLPVRDYMGLRWTGGMTFVDPTAEASPVTYKIEFWRRCTPEEAAQFTADLVDADPQLRQIFEAATELHHDAPEFALLRAAVLQRVTPARAEQLLAPSVL